MRPIIIIDGFEKGILEDPTLPVRDGFHFASGLDIHKEKGILQVSQKLEAMTEAASPNDITDGMLWMIKYSGNGKVYGLGSGGSGRIYDYDNTQAGKWCLAHDDANTGWGQGMIEFNAWLLWASNSNLGQFTGSVWTDSYKAFKSGDTMWHPMVIFLGKLMIGDGRYIATLDPDGTWDDDALILPPGYRIRSLKVHGDRLVIGLWKGTNIIDFPEAILTSWDGIVGHQPENFWRKDECGVHALHTLRNILVAFVGIQGNVYGFNGSVLDPIAKIPRVVTPAGAWGQVYPGAVCGLEGNLLFGLTSTVSEFAGLYYLEKKTGALTSPYILSPGKTSNLKIYSVLQVSAGTFYVSYYDGDSGEYKVDKINTGRRISSGAFLETQIYEIPREAQRRLLRGAEIIARPLQTDNSVTIKYKLDNAPTWLTLGTITSANQHRVLKGIKARAKTIQGRLEFATATNNNYSPEVSQFRIY